MRISILLTPLTLLLVTAFSHAQGFYPGTPGNDILGPHDDDGYYAGGFGDDVILPGGGDDEVYSDAGNDFIMDLDGICVIHADFDCQTDVIITLDMPWIPGNFDIIYADETDIIICDADDSVTIYGCGGETVLFSGTGDEYYAWAPRTAAIDNLANVVDSGWAATDPELVFLVFDLILENYTLVGESPQQTTE